MNKKILRRLGLPVLLFLLLFPSCGQEGAEETAALPSVPAETVETAEITETTKGEETGMQSVKIRRAHTLTFDEGTYAESFNRLTMTYTSAEPLRCTVFYSEDGAECSDDFFLEAGENRTFSGLTGNYLAGKKGIDLVSMTLSTCTGKETEFTLHDLTAEDYPIYSSDTYYLENERFKVGIRLMWGGGICYISDVKNPVAGLTNLINQADTGRLIQQSYYGTGPNGKYTPGNFNNSDWRYNPVQGGDKYQNHSRIIDVVVKDSSVYIKSQPQDWSLDGQITPSYMENTYTVTEDCIRVDNRFVDFSGWTHPSVHQELPAFYTVSYLDCFTWYDGSKPWTDDTLSFRDDLEFWGDPKYAADCRFPIRKSNTETWCAWTNPSDDYGIGLYVPNIDMFYAGKHAYNGSKNPDSGACNYVAPLNQLKLVSYHPIEYSYLITVGSVEDIRAVFTEKRDFADNHTLRTNYTSMRIADKAP